MSDLVWCASIFGVEFVALAWAHLARHDAPRAWAWQVLPWRLACFWSSPPLLVEEERALRAAGRGRGRGRGCCVGHVMAPWPRFVVSRCVDRGP